MNLEAKKNTCKNGGNDLLLTIMAEKKEWTVDFIKQLIDHGMSFYSIMFEIIKIKYGSLSCFQKKTGIDNRLLQNGAILREYQTQKIETICIVFWV